ncbi:MAG TPA: MaoC/PaaZ C-terminal domain-containing protein, partial [Blastocatellia bacterium]|nr:MaoC/PaaZ C-terminal domain-containing protein [Blastocatellia bacterium]
MGKYFEDFETGEESTTAGRTITETDIVNFAGITGDWNEIHTNKELAERGPFRQRIAHGALIFSISTGLSVRMGQTADTVIAFYGLDRLRFVKPTFIGDTIRVKQRVEAKSERDEH